MDRESDGWFSEFVGNFINGWSNSGYERKGARDECVDGWKAPKECVGTFYYYGNYFDECSTLGEGGRGEVAAWCATAVDREESFVVGSGAYAYCEW